MDYYPKISIVTVTYNAEKYIQKTITSILEQTYPNTEIVVVDGDSKDKTLNIIKHSMKGRDITLISEKDKGVYDAMNKGIRLTTGEWLIFMNAGDFFYSKDVLSLVFHDEIDNNVSVLYGNAEFRLKSIAYIEKPSEIVTSSQYMPFSHQASFVRTTVLKQYLFNQEFKIAADAAFFLQLVVSNYKFKYIDINICSYNALEGLSADNDLKRSIEIVKLQALLNNIDPNDEYFVNYINDAKKKSKRRKLLPNFLWNWLREKQTARKHLVYKI